MDVEQNIRNKIDMYIKDNKSDPLKIEILNNFIEYKLNDNIERILKIQKKKIEDNKKIYKLLNRVLKFFKNIYYNPFLNYYYYYEKSNFRIINYDSILVKTNSFLSQKDYGEYKKKINFKVKEFLKSKDFLEIIPDNNDILIIKRIFQNVFINDEILKYFLYFIGSCLNNRDFDIFKGNIIFFGKNSVDLIETLKYYIYDVTKLFIRSLSDIKSRYNNYNFSSCFLFKINVYDFNSFKNNLKKNKELFCIICNYYFKNNSFLNHNLYLDHIFKLNKFNTKLIFFKDYLEKRTTFDDSEELKFKDLITDFNLYLSNELLPENLFSSKEIISIMNDYYSNFVKKKNIFLLSLNNHNKKELFDSFFNENVVFETDNVLNSDHIDLFLKKWFKSKSIVYSYLTKKEFKRLLLQRQNIVIKDYLYFDIKLLNFDKKQIYKKFINQNIINSDQDIIFLLDIKSRFDKWYFHNFPNYPLLQLNDLKFYLINLLDNYDNYRFGWTKYKLID